MRLALAIFFAAAPAMAETPIGMIDAVNLTVAELMALAATERDNADRHDCCDWGGMGCRVETLAWASERQSYPPAAPAMPLMADPEAPE